MTFEVRRRLLRVQCFLASLLLLISVTTHARAATLPAGFAETLITNELQGPTAMAFAPDGRLFVCQQGGQLRVIKNGTLLATPFLTVSTDSTGERGLLGVAFDPNFGTNHFVYIYYTVLASPIHNRVSRFTANGDVAVAGSEV
ncbi:MAG TPA: PQQ-dependent sugar dehydrogenase, partial [Pyrinomonadaceae bacterium]|nr:PQQ-dependent sugar dehydrogenase [Pyrinomonadaceae bacterium]